MSTRINNIQFNYENFSLKADLEIASGEFVSILGPSGSGKTTLLRLLAGFLKPDAGTITVNGHDITAAPTSSRNIGMVFQDYALFPHMNVFHNIAYGLKSQKAGREDIRSRVEELLELVGLSDYGNRRVNELSGGEKQRVALARAIAPEPELLLFDEPLSALDVKLRLNLRREIVRIQKEVGFTAVYVTHDQEEAMSISDRIAVMNNGAITQIGTPEQLYNEPVDFFTADFIGRMNRINNDMFRPEACSLLKDDDDLSRDGINSDYILDTAVESSEYAGGYYICEGLSGDNLIKFYSNSRLFPGTKVKIIVNSEKIIRC